MWNRISNLRLVLKITHIKWTNGKQKQTNSRQPFSRLFVIDRFMRFILLLIFFHFSRIIEHKWESFEVYFITNFMWWTQIDQIAIIFGQHLIYYLHTRGFGIITITTCQRHLKAFWGSKNVFTAKYFIGIPNMCLYQNILKWRWHVVMVIMPKHLRYDSLQNNLNF